MQKRRGATGEETAASATSDFTQVNILLLNTLKPLWELSSALMTLITVYAVIHLITYSLPALYE